MKMFDYIDEVSLTESQKTLLIEGAEARAAKPPMSLVRKNGIMLAAGLTAVALFFTAVWVFGDFARDPNAVADVGASGEADEERLNSGVFCGLCSDSSTPCTVKYCACGIANQITCVVNGMNAFQSHMCRFPDEVSFPAATDDGQEYPDSYCWCRVEGCEHQPPWTSHPPNNDCGECGGDNFYECGCIDFEPITPPYEPTTPSGNLPPCAYCGSRERFTDCRFCLCVCRLRTVEQLCHCGGVAGGYCDCGSPCPRDFCDCDSNVPAPAGTVDLGRQGVTDTQLAAMVRDGRIPRNTEVLMLFDNRITDLSPLASLTNLRELYLCDNNIRDLSPLRNLTNLEQLSLTNSNVRDLSPLRNLTNLTSLQMWNNQITDLSPLRNLTNLEYLGLMGNNISDISPLVGLLNLTAIDLCKNNVRNIMPLRMLTSLEHVWIRNNNISDISALGSLPNLRVLVAADNNISDVTPLADLPQLGFVTLDNNPITDITPLANVRTLQHLQIFGTPVSDSQRLALRDALPGLNVGLESEYAGAEEVRR